MNLSLLLGGAKVKELHFSLKLLYRILFVPFLNLVLLCDLTFLTLADQIDRLDVHQLIIDGGGRVDFGSFHCYDPMLPYSLEESEIAFRRVAQDHNWSVL